MKEPDMKIKKIIFIKKLFKRINIFSFVFSYYFFKFIIQNHLTSLIQKLQLVQLKN